MFSPILGFEIPAFRAVYRSIAIERASRYRGAGALDGVSRLRSVRWGLLSTRTRSALAAAPNNEDTLRRSNECSLSNVPEKSGVAAVHARDLVLGSRALGDRVGRTDPGDRTRLRTYP